MSNYIFGGLIGFLFGATVLLIIPKSPTEPPKSEFSVVGIYKDCEVVQYTRETDAKSHYFLYCDKK